METTPWCAVRYRQRRHQFSKVNLNPKSETLNPKPWCAVRYRQRRNKIFFKSTYSVRCWLFRIFRVDNEQYQEPEYAYSSHPIDQGDRHTFWNVICLVHTCTLCAHTMSARHGLLYNTRALALLCTRTMSVQY
jgi:hypothetical protein